MSLVDRIKQHYADFGVQKIEVPEWGGDGNSLVVYFKPITLGEKQRYVTASAQVGRIAAFAELLVMKALDADGKKLFTIEHKKMLRDEADPDVILRVCTEMLASPGADDMGKDLSKTTD